jgi:hypothetical protein
LPHYQPSRHREVLKCSCSLSLRSALDVGGCLTSNSGHLPPGNDSVPLVQETKWVSGPLWAAAEILASTEIRSPDRSARSDIFYIFIVIIDGVGASNLP